MFLNKVTLIGFLGRDPQVRSLPSGTLAVTLNVATDYVSKTPEGNSVSYTEWHRVKVYGPLAKVAANYLHKGRQVYLEGKLKTESWRDSSGKQKSWVVVEASQLVMLDRRSQAAGTHDSTDTMDMSWLETRAPQPTRQERVPSVDIPF